MVLGDEIGLEIAIGFFRRHVDHAAHVEQPHRFEDIETALDVHPHGLHRNLERGAHPDDRRTMHHSVGPKLLQCGCDARPFDDLAGDKRDLALPRHEGVESGAAAKVERQHFIPTRNQRCGKLGADEARASSDEISRPCFLAAAAGRDDGRDRLPRRDECPAMPPRLTAAEFVRNRIFQYTITRRSGVLAPIMMCGRDFSEGGAVAGGENGARASRVLVIDKYTAPRTCRLSARDLRTTQRR